MFAMAFSANRNGWGLAGVCISSPGFGPMCKLLSLPVSPVGQGDLGPLSRWPRSASRCTPGAAGPGTCLRVQWDRCRLKAKLRSPVDTSTSWFIPVLLRMCCAGVGFSSPLPGTCVHAEALAGIYYATLLRCSCNAQENLPASWVLQLCTSSCRG